MIEVQKRQNLFGNLSVDGDKSITIRAILLGALSSGKTIIHNPLISQDSLSALDCAQKMGATIIKQDNLIEIVGTQKITNGCVFNCENSGTLARFLIGILAGAGVEATIVGDESLSKRPMDRVCLPLIERGAKIISNNGKLPVKIFPASLKEFEYNMPIDSAQVKSAILLSGVTSGKKTIINERNFTRDHTERMLIEFGANVSVNEKRITLNGGNLTSCELFVPADPSSSAYYLTLGLCLGEITVKNILHAKGRNGFIDKILQAGGKLNCFNKGNLGIFEVFDITAYKSSLNFFEVENNEIATLIDEIPLLALIGAVNNGCVIKGAEELKVKESDRLYETVKLLSACGAKAQIVGSDLVISGSNDFKEFEYESDDHRMIMTAFCASCIVANAKISGENSVNISFPSFYKNYYELQMGLIGKSVSNSFSGSIHKFVLNSFNCENFLYEQRSISEREFENFIKKCSYKAFNATSPFKELLCDRLNGLDEISNLAHSVNFVFSKKGYSTDGAGLILSLKYYGYNILNKRVLVYGIGGAGKAVALALKNAGAEVFVTNRTFSKAEQFCNEHNDIKLYNGETCDILINATTNKDEFIFNKNALKGCELIIDINYRQALALEGWAQQNNKKFINGFAMLFFQAYVCDMILLEKVPNYQEAFKLFNEYKENYEN